MTPESPDTPDAGSQNDSAWLTPIVLMWVAFFSIGFDPAGFYTLIRKLGGVVTQEAWVNSPSIITGALALYIGWFAYQRCIDVNLHKHHAVGHGLMVFVLGIMAFVGCTLLLHRRLIDPRIRKTSSWGDLGVLTLLWLQIALGLMTTIWTIDHLDGKEMLKFMAWAQGLYRLNPGAADLILDAYFIYKLHIVLGLTLFLITPFTRLVHIWSAPIWYLGRRGYQVVRTSGRPTARVAARRNAQPAE